MHRPAQAGPDAARLGVAFGASLAAAYSWRQSFLRGGMVGVVIVSQPVV